MSKLNFYTSRSKSSLELRSSKPSVLYSLSLSSSVPLSVKPIEKQPAPSPKPPQFTPKQNLTPPTTPLVTPELEQQPDLAAVYPVLAPALAQQLIFEAVPPVAPPIEAQQLSPIAQVQQGPESASPAGRRQGIYPASTTSSC